MAKRTNDMFIHEIKKSDDDVDNNQLLKNMIFCITGKTELYKNRKALKEIIEINGGKVTDAVSSKTSYLISNNATSTTIKHETAKKLNVPIISEYEFQTLITLPNPQQEPKYVS